MSYLELYNGPLSVFAAGAAGAVVRLIVAPPANSRLRLAHVISGALMALFVAPGAVEYWLSGSSIAVQRMLAVAIGVAGPLIAEISVRVIQRRGTGVADRLVDRLTGSEDRKS
ncbi:hypothetical protein [Ralstonia syzygii]|uniref:hypothetical protein n=1 Tax=Ralstonia syzygii TaxID=28097 RepID=UPI0018D1CEB6|nr:hypothetical protein [Ralstonia syzygii]